MNFGKPDQILYAPHLSPYLVGQGPTSPPKVILEVVARITNRNSGAREAEQADGMPDPDGHVLTSQGMTGKESINGQHESPNPRGPIANHKRVEIKHDPHAFKMLGGSIVRPN